MEEDTEPDQTPGNTAIRSLPALIQLAERLIGGNAVTLVRKLRKSGDVGVFRHTEGPSETGQVQIPADLLPGPIVHRELLPRDVEDADQVESQAVTSTLEEIPGITTDNLVVKRRPAGDGRTELVIWKRDHEFVLRTPEQRVGTVRGCNQRAAEQSGPAGRTRPRIHPRIQRLAGRQAGCEDSV